MRTNNIQSGRSGKSSGKRILYDARGNRIKSDPLSNKYIRFLLFYVLPYLVINGLILLLVCSTPRINVNVKDTDNYVTTDISFTVKSLLPIKELNITLESEPVEYTKSGGTYTCTVDKNGTLAIEARSLNGMSRSVYTDINELDDAAPSIDESSINYSRGDLSFNISDTLSGVNFSTIYGTLDNGERIEPNSYDANTGDVMMILPKTAESVELHFEDMVGNAGTGKISVQVSDGSESDGSDGSAGYTEGDAEDNANAE